MNKWKVTAIVFIILFILESVLFFYLYSVGTEIVSGRQTCSDICYVKEATGFYYDSSSGICTCYDVSGDEVYSGRIE